MIMKVLGVLLLLIGFMVLAIMNWDSVLIFWHALQDPAYIPPPECGP